jgi:hypothetical protein
MEVMRRFGFTELPPHIAPFPRPEKIPLFKSILCTDVHTVGSFAKETSTMLERLKLNY